MQKRRPLIGITSRGCKEESPNSVPEPYLRSIVNAGGEPVILPSINGADQLSILEMINGLICSGGGDLYPGLYNGTAHPSTTYGIDRERDDAESEIIRLALKREILSLFICRGIQLVNALAGGDLHPHIPDSYGTSVRHRLDLPFGKFHPTEHTVLIQEDSLLKAATQTENLNVISCHHQAIRTVGQDWRVVAMAEDRVIEAVEHCYHP
jgi:putative glutamine amidotransferase